MSRPIIKQLWLDGHQVATRYGVDVAHILTLHATDNEFPKAVRFGDNVMRWHIGDLDAYDKRLRRTDQGDAND